MKVAGMMGEKILGLPYEWGVIIIAAVFIFYNSHWRYVVHHFD